MDIPDTPGCVCGRGGRAEQRQANGGLWLSESEGATPSSLSTSFLTKNKPFPIRGMQICVRVFESICDGIGAFVSHQARSSYPC